MLRKVFIPLIALVVVGFGVACGASGDSTPRAESPAVPGAGTPAPVPSDGLAKKASRPAGTPRIVFLGDSLTVGLGLPERESYPSLIQDRLDREGYDYEVVNAGVSGDTSAGGLRRLDWSLDGNVKILVLALGANDGLRGLPIDALRKNLSTIIERCAARSVSVILAGMEAPPNNGPEYASAFRASYNDLAREHRVSLIPFLLQGVAGDTTLNQSDGIHPNTRGAQIIADVVWRALSPALSPPTTTK